MTLGPSFYSIVRPEILPKIRPTAERKIAAFTDPDQGFAVIHGNPAKQLNLTTSKSISTSRSNGVEYQRRVDLMRVYQKNDDGTVNRDNFIDVEIANRLRVRDAKGTTTTYFKRLPQKDNIELLEENLIYSRVAGADL